MNSALYEQEINKLLEIQTARIKCLSVEEISTNSFGDTEDVYVAGELCKLTIFVQELSAGSLLVTIQVARPVWMGFAHTHWERGLVFSPEGIRDATDLELAESD